MEIQGLHRVTRGYKGLQRVPIGYSGLQGVKGGYNGFGLFLNPCFIV